MHRGTGTVKCPICSPIGKLHQGPGTENYVLTSKNLLFSTKDDLYSHLLKEHSPKDVASSTSNLAHWTLNF